MKTITLLLFIVTVFATLSLSSSVFGQAPQVDLHAKLLLADNKSTYRIGEPIKLIIEFTADRDGYQADTIPDQWEPTTLHQMLDDPGPHSPHPPSRCSVGDPGVGPLPRPSHPLTCMVLPIPASGQPF